MNYIFQKSIVAPNIVNKNNNLLFGNKLEEFDKLADKNSKFNEVKRLTELMRKVFKKEVSELLRKGIGITENQLERLVNNDLADTEHQIEEIYGYQIDPDNFQ